MYTLTLSDNTTLTGLTLNGNNFITSDRSITRETFSGKLSHISITSDNLPPVIFAENDIPPDWDKFDDPTICGEFDNYELAHFRTDKNGLTWFVLREIPPDRLERMKLRADLAYIAMMTDTDL